MKRASNVRGHAKNSPADRSVGLSLDHDLDESVTLDHELIDEIGWKSDFIPSVLPRSEEFLQSEEGRGVLEVLVRLEDANVFKGVIDLALAASNSKMRRATLAFYEGRGPDLTSLHAEAQLDRVDRQLERWLRTMANVYSTLASDSVDVDAIDRLLRRALLAGGFKLRPPNIPPEQVPQPSASTGSAPPQSPIGSDSPPTPVRMPLPRLVVMPSKEIVFDRETGLLWQRRPPAVAMNWADAKKYAVGLELDGRGWSLPSRVELVSLRQRSDPPFVDEVAFPDCPRGWYWTRERSDVGGFAYAVSFALNDVRDCAATWTFQVRCVRSG